MSHRMGYSVRHRRRQALAPQALRRIGEGPKHTHSLRYRGNGGPLGEPAITAYDDLMMNDDVASS